MKVTVEIDVITSGDTTLSEVAHTVGSAVERCLRDVPLATEVSLVEVERNPL